ncbi:MAG: hypothetical protein A3G34_15250 [Candidatus Lindowbacteria bacterium RIFCSPLOWO2_12_FULL_62_27]|nr:MAG: hypothetical protein A3G34_15250 [Candidatus Lindowbacteria bacterium RIFCSPLOWO2_12_FULL_62_27]OGH63880.1 MAG: hypothetical protein A3I06_06230 [Candidatus Lindowbacteria bacterium RIFCSPLOWO2_02_FULL_62_12]
MEKTEEKLLDIQDLRVHFHTRHGVVKAVDGVSFGLERGEVLGIVGESGSGKSVTCLSVLGLLPAPPARIESGRALLAGRDLLTLDAESLRRVRGKSISMIFQEPMTSLNPYLKIGVQLVETLRAHEAIAAEAARARAIRMLDRVGIADAGIRMDGYPHELSGGMRQRVMIAMALLTQPDILIADEPTTALDVTIQAQILELIRELKAEFGMAVILISHAMGVVAEMSDRILVMYAGRVVEQGNPGEIFRHPAHPYTKALIDSMPNPNASADRLPAIAGTPPDLARLPAGCAFAPRCGFARPVCRETDPDERTRPASETPALGAPEALTRPGSPTRSAEPGHAFRCHVDI